MIHLSQLRGLRCGHCVTCCKEPTVLDIRNSFVADRFPDGSTSVVSYLKLVRSKVRSHILQGMRDGRSWRASFHPGGGGPGPSLLRQRRGCPQTAVLLPASKTNISSKEDLIIYVGPIVMPPKQPSPQPLSLPSAWNYTVKATQGSSTPAAIAAAAAPGPYGMSPALEASASRSGLAGYSSNGGEGPGPGQWPPQAPVPTFVTQMALQGDPRHPVPSASVLNTPSFNFFPHGALGSVSHQQHGQGQSASVQIQAQFGGPGSYAMLPCRSVPCSASSTPRGSVLPLGFPSYPGASAFPGLHLHQAQPASQYGCSPPQGHVGPPFAISGARSGGGGQFPATLNYVGGFYAAGLGPPYGVGYSAPPPSQRRAAMTAGSGGNSAGPELGPTGAGRSGSFPSGHGHGIPPGPAGPPIYPPAFSTPVSPNSHGHWMQQLAQFRLEVTKREYERLVMQLSAMAAKGEAAVPSYAASGHGMVVNASIPSAAPGQ